MNEIVELTEMELEAASGGGNSLFGNFDIVVDPTIQINLAAFNKVGGDLNQGNKILGFL
jgi:hypothetical protein